MEGVSCHSCDIVLGKNLHLLVCFVSSVRRTSQSVYLVRRGWMKRRGWSARHGWSGWSDVRFEDERWGVMRGIVGECVRHGWR